MAAFASMPLSYKRLYSGPLDEDTVFESLEDAQTYASGPTSYPGQVIGVKVDNTNYKSYTINEDKTLNGTVDSSEIDDIRSMFCWEEI